MGFFFFYPFLELLSLIYLGQRIGFGYLLIYLGSSVLIGMTLIRSAGINSVRSASPTVVLEAPFRLMAGILILIPGLISDVCAFLVLVPFVRKFLWKHFFVSIFQGRVLRKEWPTGRPYYQSSADEIIDVTPQAPLKRDDDGNTGVDSRARIIDRS